MLLLMLLLLLLVMMRANELSDIPIATLTKTNGSVICVWFYCLRICFGLA